MIYIITFLIIIGLLISAMFFFGDSPSFLKVLEVLYAFVGPGLVLAICYGLWCYVSFVLDHSYFTERGKQWHLQNNPEFWKAAALERMAAAQEKSTTSKPK